MRSGEAVNIDGQYTDRATWCLCCHKLIFELINTVDQLKK